MHVLDMGEDYIKEYLKITGKTREELEADRELMKKHISPDKGFDGIKGLDSPNRDKFDGDPGFEIIE